MTWLDSAPPSTDDGADRVEEGLRDLGLEHQPAPGWEERVFATLDADPPSIRPRLATVALWLIPILVTGSIVVVLVLIVRGAL